MAESLILPVVNSLLQKAANGVLEQFGLMWGIDAERQKLCRHLEAIQSILVDAEGRAEKDHYVKTWMNELKAAAYDAEDVLDEFEYEALRHKAEIRRSSMTMKVTNFFTAQNPVMFRFTMSRQIKGILARIDKIVVEMNKFRFIIARSEPQQIVDRDTWSFVDESAVVGRSEDKKRIVDLLLDQHESKNVSVLPIVGMGGLGKTTLAQLIYNDERVQQHFELLLWVCVSDKFTFTDVAKSIITAATNDECQLGNKEQLQTQLRGVLNQKRYLLILDDVWNEDREKWEELRSLLCSCNGPGSVIVVTSRSQQVASIMGTRATYHLGRLSEDDSWNVFKTRAFSMGVKELPELVGIGKSIVEKCQGLPLVVKTIGALMSSKRERRQWLAVMKSDIWENLVSGSESRVLPILKLSYDHLPPYMQRCFAYCALFPKDYKIDKEMLIQLWMANDFIPTVGSTDLADTGRQIFDEMAWRSFFQEVKQVEICEDRYDGFLRQTASSKTITICKMHDIMHDLAQSIVDKECIVLSESEVPSEARHLLIFEEPSGQAGKSLRGNRTMRTLLGSYAYRYYTFEFKHDLFASKTLRVLDARFANSVPRGIGCMKHLRYLDLSGGEFKLLPEATTRLHCLQTLKLNHCRVLHQLPEGMRYMSSLRHLYLVGCVKLEHMPTGIGQLTSLQTLTNYVVDSQTGRGIAELKNLDLVGQLQLYNLRKVTVGADAREAGLVSKRNLRKLILSWGNSELGATNDEEVLGALVPPNELEILCVDNYGGVELATWMRDFQVLQNLTELRLLGCKHCKHLPPLWQLPLLKSLFLSGLDSLTHFCSANANISEEGNTTTIVFPVLEILELYGMPSFVGWHQSTDSQVQLTFPQLEHMVINRCPLLTSMPVVPLIRKLEANVYNTTICFSITSLSAPEEVKIYNLSESCADKEVIRFQPWESLQKLVISKFNNLTPPQEEVKEKECHKSGHIRELLINDCSCFFISETSRKGLGFWKYFSSLVVLRIDSCDFLIYWPEEEFQSLNCLKTLDVQACKNLIGSSLAHVSSTTSNIDFLPKLETLTIGWCDSLLEVPRCSTSLKKLDIAGCERLLSSGLGNLQELKSLHVHDCDSLKSLPDGMECLTALQHLSIYCCDVLESLPEGLLRLSNLQKLEICLCPVLEKHCKRGGKYWGFISRIPNVDIQGSKSSMKGIMKKLVLSCGRDGYSS